MIHRMNFDAAPPVLFVLVDATVCLVDHHAARSWNSRKMSCFHGQTLHSCCRCVLFQRPIHFDLLFDDMDMS